MKLLKRLWPLFAAVAVVVLAIALMQNHMLPRTHGAEGTQSDPHVGTSKYPAPKDANSTPPADALASITDPNSISPLADVNAKCDSAPPHPANRPSLQDDGKGTQQYADMPSSPSAATYKCAIARAKKADYYVAGNSVKCDEDVIKLHDASTNKNWNFRPFCMTVSKTGDPTCKVTLVITDSAGNFLWREQPDLPRLQNFLADGVRNDPSYAGC